MKIRKTLTEVLLEVTNREVLDIALETLDEERSKNFISWESHIQLLAI